MDGRGPQIAGVLRDVRVRLKVSQLELASRAGTTQRHLSFIESGRSVPGRELVIRLADSLDLPLRERNALLLASGFAPAYPESSFGDAALRPVREALQRILDGHLPYPAIVVDRLGRIVASNSAVQILTEGVSAQLLESPINAYRLALHPEGLARRTDNLAEWGRHITNRIRQELQQGPGPELELLLTELLTYLPNRVGEPARPALGFAVPLQLRTAAGDLRLITTITTFATATDVTLAELKLEAFLPADESTAAVLADIPAAGQTGPPGRR